MEPKKFLFISTEGYIVDMALSVIKEGHFAKCFIEDSEEKEIGDGFVEKIDDWKKKHGKTIE